MTKVLVIYDANILIDFCKLGLVDEMFRLRYEFRTVDVVWEELRKEQQQAYLPYVATGELLIAQIDEEELMEVYSVRRMRPQLSFPDCTALIYAKNREGILLTSDKNLRSTARQNSVEVRGHLWIFDSFFSDGIMEGVALIDKLRELCEKVNPRLGLPEEECGMRICKWREYGK